MALDLLGEPNRALSSKHELRYGNNGSLSVTIAGDGRGQWYSLEEGHGGGVLDLIVRERGGTRAQAMHWLRSQPYGPKSAGARTRPAQPRKARSAPARFFLNTGQHRLTHRAAGKRARRAI